MNSIPGHGKVSVTPVDDLQKALESARSLFEDSKVLFEALDSKATFERLFLAARRLPQP